MSGKESVLLIEDNPGFRYLFRDALEFLGHEVFEAEDGETGLLLARGRKPDLILLDLMIPKVNGMEVLRQLKEDPNTRDIRIVMLSVLNEPKDIQKSFELGADDYIVKGTASPEQIIKRSCELLTQNFTV